MVETQGRGFDSRPSHNQKSKIMKTKIVLRGLLQYALFAIGFTALAFAFGDTQKETPVEEWRDAFVLSFGVATACFYALYRMLRNH